MKYVHALILTCSIAGQAAADHDPITESDVMLCETEAQMAGLVLNARYKGRDPIAIAKEISPRIVDTGVVDPEKNIGQIMRSAHGEILCLSADGRSEHIQSFIGWTYGSCIDLQSMH